MTVNELFYFVFLSQIVLISLYYPRKVLHRISLVLDLYPPSRYPKLYPESMDKVERGRRNYTIMNGLIFALGLILLFGYGMLSAEYGANQKHAEGLPLFYGLIQFIPLMLMEISGFKQFKLMRAANIQAKRTAQLQPRKLFDFISPLFVGTAVLMFLIYVLMELYLPQFQFRVDGAGISKMVTLSVTNLLLIGLIIWNVSGKKHNPHQAQKDRLVQIGFSVKSLVIMSIAASAFYIVTVVMEDFDLEYLEIIANSLYFQLIAVMSIGYMLRILKIEDIDFEGYRGDESSVHQP